MAYTHIKLGKLAQAEQSYLDVKKSLPNNRERGWYLAEIYAGLGEIAAIRGEFDRAIELVDLAIESRRSLLDDWDNGFKKNQRGEVSGQLRRSVDSDATLKRLIFLQEKWTKDSSRLEKHR